MGQLQGRPKGSIGYAQDLTVKGKALACFGKESQIYLGSPGKAYKGSNGITGTFYQNIFSL
jgi:hypothetical protein